MRYAIVEVFGHRRYAGLVEEVSLAGQPMLRVTTPAWARATVERRYLYPDEATPEGLSGDVERDIHEAHDAFVVHLGGAALFAVTWCAEAQVSAVLREGRAHAGGTCTVVEGPWRRRGTPPALEIRDVDPTDDEDEDEEVIETRAIAAPAAVAAWCHHADCYTPVKHWGDRCDAHRRADPDADLAPEADLPREPTLEAPPVDPALVAVVEQAARHHLDQADELPPEPGETVDADEMPF